MLDYYVDIARAFGFTLDAQCPLESIYHAAPVFRLANAAGSWIVKRTQKPLARGLAVAHWTRSLAAKDIAVVTPAEGFGDNPRSFQNAQGEQEVWVVYPFIEGVAYRGDSTQIRAAGDLLGKIHAQGLPAAPGLTVRKTAVAIDADELAQDVEKSLAFVQQVFPAHTDVASAILKERTHHYFQEALPRLLAIDLPLINGCWDYKAANLVYTTDTTPVLVDADNGGHIPRICDLATAALLFHSDVEPGRVFTQAEWMIFLEGYARHVQLSDWEKQHWADLLLCTWIDEALWLLQDDAAGWAHPRQSKMLLSLLLSDLATFAL